MSPRKGELLPGTLEMLILKALTLVPMHGYGIAQHLQQVSADVVRVEEGSLYPALQRMRQKGWVKAEWKQTPNKQRARYYTITSAGRKELGTAHASFAEMITAISHIMGTA